MAKTQQQSPLTWTELDPDTLHAEAAEAYRSYQKIYAKAKAAREKFEKLCAKRADVPETHRMIFSYKFDRLSVAIDVAKTKSAGPKAIDFNTLKARLPRRDPS